jgi:transmembrane sensor
MENKPEFDKLIVSYLMRELNAEEENFLINAINDDDALHNKFDEFEKLGRLLNIKHGVDSINLHEERKRFERLIKERNDSLKGDYIDEAAEVRMDTGKLRKFRLGRWVAAAAALVIIVGAGWFLSQNRQQKETSTAVENKLERQKPMASLRVEKNNSGKHKQIQLQDGTEILLWDQTEISFKEPFDADKRDIILKGKASFKVAKDKAKPFTVYSGDISITALGTEFVVTNYERDQIITVRLLEGRVVINSVDSATEKLKTAFYLMPGQELLYNKRSVHAEVRKFRTDVTQKEFKYKGNKSVDNPSIPESNDGSWFMFNNQSLPDIFDQLKAMYAIDIVYNKSELEKLYFIGSFNKSDTVEYILRSIAKTNRLNLSKENNRFIIRK